MLFARQVTDFLKTYRKLLLAPLLTVGLIVAAVVLLSQGSKIVPFVYKLF
jgi:hypothetical protein